MVSGKIMIKSKTGLHLRPAGVLCNLAINYPCKIELRSNLRTVNAKSVLGVLSACIKHGEEVELMCDGDNEEEAFLVISKILADDFENYDSGLN